MCRPLLDMMVMVYVTFWPRHRAGSCRGETVHDWHHNLEVRSEKCTVNLPGHRKCLQLALLSRCVTLLHLKGNVAVYKDLNLVTVAIKRNLSCEHSEKMQ